MLSVVNNQAQPESFTSSLDAIVREGARKMLLSALQAEVDDFIEQCADERDDEGHRLVVRNGTAKERRVTTSSGTLQVAAPRVNDRRVIDGEKQTFHSAILPPWCRKSPEVVEVLPLLYLHGMSTGDFAPALSGFFGAQAGLSASTVNRLTQQYQDDYRAFAKRDLSETDYVYTWVDGVHTRVRLEEERLCALVMIGVKLDGTKELIAIRDGYRESSESWADLLRDCKRRGMRAPVLAIGDGALGFWKALRDVFPETKEQRCWFHKIANVLDAMPKSQRPNARAMLQEIWNAEDKDHANSAMDAFVEMYSAKFPNACDKLTKDRESLLRFYDFPAEHWKHLRTTNPIESTFATVRLRQRVTKGPGSRSQGLAMCFKLIEAAQARWRPISGAGLVPLVRAGAHFENGVLVECPCNTEKVPA